MSKTINCDQVIWLQSALERYASLSVVTNQWPEIAREPYGHTNQLASMKKPIDILLDKVKGKCTICGKQNCDCWNRCLCGWSYRAAGECNNPQHREFT